MTPPVLPGEVWRGDVRGPVCVTTEDDVPCAWWWHESIWIRTEAGDIFTAWALSLRADAQRAAEEMRERCAEAAYSALLGCPIHRGRSGPGYLESASDVAKAAVLHIPAHPSPKPPAGPANDADLWALVRARLGGPLIQIIADYRDASSPAPTYVATWRRMYPDALSDYRQTTCHSEAACLRAVLAWEDAADSGWSWLGSATIEIPADDARRLIAAVEKV